MKVKRTLGEKTLTHDNNNVITKTERLQTNEPQTNRKTGQYRRQTNPKRTKRSENEPQTNRKLANIGDKRTQNEPNEAKTNHKRTKN